MKNHNNSSEKLAFRFKGWMWFGGVVSLQILFVVMSYVLKIS